MSKLPLSLLLLLTLISLNYLPTSLQKPSNDPKNIHVHKHVQSLAKSTWCDGTLYTDLCASTVAALPELRQKTLQEVISHTINVTVKEVRDSTTHCRSIRHNLQPLERRALEDCLTLFDDTVEQMDTVLADLSSSAAPEKYHADVQTYLSAAMTNQYTCLDGFENSKGNTRRLIEGRVRRISRHLSNSLAMAKNLKKKESRKNAAAVEEKEQFPGYGRMRGGFPAWLSRSDRRLLQAAVNETKIDLVVAQDGSGNFKTINEALSAAPNNSKTRYVIHIKTGAYFEYVTVESNKKNIMFLGDGIGKTWIKGDKNYAENTSTYDSCTVAAKGINFIAKGLSIENYAGPSGEQAVAFRSSADFSAYYQCSFIGYQDTLYVHSNRQFYRDCDIYGTVDFIFGNAAVVIQNCNLYARRPNPKQKNMFTAQGRDDINQNTGISIINSKVAAAADLLPVLNDFPTYLGRPWKMYSRTVYMYCNMESVVNPKGWYEWDGNFALATLYYGEYMNRGPGSNTVDRVTWPGYRVITSSAEASQFTVANFIQGNDWLPATGVPFFPNLTATTIATVSFDDGEIASN